MSAATASPAISKWPKAAMWKAGPGSWPDRNSFCVAALDSPPARVSPFLITLPAAEPPVELQNGLAALNVSECLGHPDDRMSERLRRLTAENVLMQLAHRKTHPSVAGAIARERLTVSGWVYEIGTGEVRIAEDGHRDFVPMGKADLSRGG
jgi:hypothetical protein